MDIRPEDARTLVELANTVEDCSPQEIEVLSRVQKALTEYERQASLEQEKALDDDKGYGIGD